MNSQEVLTVTEEELRTIKKGYNRSPDGIAEDINTIRDWLKQQPHLPVEQDDQILETTLCINKFSLDKTKKKLEVLYTARTMFPEYFENREPLNKKMRNQDFFYLAPCPKLTRDAERIVVYKLHNPDVSKFDIACITKYVFNTADLRLKYEAYMNDHYIIDVANYSVGHLTQMTPLWVKQFYTIIAKGYSDRVVGIHILNLPNALAPLITIVKSVLSEKLANRLYIHKNIDSLHKIIPKESLPIEYGGSKSSLEELHGKWKTFMEENNKFIVEQQYKRSNEKLRVGEPISSEMFGCDGSFRILKDID